MVADARGAFKYVAASTHHEHEHKNLDVAHHVFVPIGTPLSGAVVRRGRYAMSEEALSGGRRQGSGIAVFAAGSVTVYFFVV